MKSANNGVLFSDISDSTGLYRRHGDDLAKEGITRCIGVMRRIVGQYGGQVIDQIGDEIMSGKRADKHLPTVRVKRDTRDPASSFDGQPDRFQFRCINKLSCSILPARRQQSGDQPIFLQARVMLLTAKPEHPDKTQRQVKRQIRRQIKYRPIARQPGA